jgi:hypothetical protein
MVQRCGLDRAIGQICTCSHYTSLSTSWGYSKLWKVRLWPRWGWRPTSSTHSFSWSRSVQKPISWFCLIYLHPYPPHTLSFLPSHSCNFYIYYYLLFVLSISTKSISNEIKWSFFYHSCNYFYNSANPPLNLSSDEPKTRLFRYSLNQSIRLIWNHQHRLDFLGYKIERRHRSSVAVHRIDSDFVYIEDFICVKSLNEQTSLFDLILWLFSTLSPQTPCVPGILQYRKSKRYRLFSNPAFRKRTGHPPWKGSLLVEHGYTLERNNKPYLKFHMKK